MRTAMEPPGVCMPPRDSEGTGALSTPQASFSFEWKQEVNRRIAEHRRRKGPSIVETNATPERRNSRRGAEAAARVAERFAHARSYSEMLSQEASAAHAALDTPPDLQRFELGESAAHGEMEEPETAQVLQWEDAHETVAISMTPAEESIPTGQTEEMRAEEMPLFDEVEADAYVQRAEESTGVDGGAAEAPEPAQPIHANLIEFPREVVATRRMRPRLVEGLYSAARAAQLSIFEVDPDAISTEVAAASAAAAPAWNPAEWSGIELDAEPAEEAVKKGVADPAGTPPAQLIDPAPMSRRLLAVVVDAALICSALIGAAAVFAAHVESLPGPRGLAMGAGGALLLVAAIYMALFFSLARETPGMKYACVSLCTFGDQHPTREQRLRRLATMALSVLPLGLGLVWSLFDEERLCWHDRLSQTYLREC